MYEFDSYHILLAGAGAIIIASYWLPRYFSGREPAAAPLLILTGLVLFLFVPGMPAAIDPLTNPFAWEATAELAVIIGLFGVGLRIDKLFGHGLWKPTFRLLVFGMPLTIIALALFGWMAAGMTLAGGLLLGAILSPTDPVLAGDVQVGPPLEGGEHPVRYALTTEAGLNDGLAFPFVHLGIAIASAGAITGALLTEWVLIDVAYRIAMGALGGAASGWLLGRILFFWPRSNALSLTQAGVIAFAGVIFAYGLTELAEGYGFIAAFVAGLVLRRVESEDRFHERLHSFSEALEHTLTAIILVALGAAIPVLWPYLDLSHALIGLALIFLIRPLLGWLSLAGAGLPSRERWTVAFYGIRGIGSIYYLAYAGNHVELVDEGALWATVAFTIVVSAIVHGLSAGVAVSRATGEEEAPA
ncbi:sodium:proton antiporter [Erythrobacter arachoides]|uniref:Sodium:proton antiporter n=1 Tax=Aurantiacibacter arachoides TaxID=1850444 RepID=A0A844ZYC8_9SPHN|nr:cation:proton antiporter [Aurantiacibacter arachoides]MXO92464.1 sodium:proton antiporter [Aurantiacibacter arachoides]GGD56983.1 cation transporter [Aurantiacibacter arachoides]